MTMQSTIETKISDALAPDHLEVMNESHMHNVPPGSESHFKLVIVTDEFSGVSRVGRHQKINGILSEELRGGIHALSMETHTPDEWTAKGGQIMASPACHGGSKADR
jgi:BolA family transcriptional regulator, general stress-responsive regulator